MGSMGYQRSAKRCKQKWENINKYFRKTKDSAKKRPHNFKTCSYFNQLDQLYSGTPITAPSSSSSYYSSNPSASMDDNIPKQGFSDLLESLRCRERGRSRRCARRPWEGEGKTLRMMRTWMKRKILMMMILMNKVERDHQTELERISYHMKLLAKSTNSSN
ncbi:hypothetical protein GBA52_028372 [Prunus armeniaca]|nr:hypothetical protein GBA52_028372 [Prunus armeniaca]